MPVKDKLVTWYIQNIIIPRREIIDKPGFVVTMFTEQKYTTYLREFFLPEPLFEIIESKIIEYYGEQGKQALYSAGKKFGYLYASMSNFPTIKDATKKEFAEFIYFFVRYIESTYSEQADHNLDIDQKLSTMSVREYIVCRHNGLGYIMTDGACAGICAYEFQDKTIEGIQLQCQGRGDEECYILCAPKEKIQEKTNKILIETNLFEQELNNEYKALNEIRETKYSQNSLKHLIDLGFFEFKQGILSYKNMRFFPCESNIIYLIEEEIGKLKDGEQHLFDACFEYGKILQEKYGDNDFQKFLIDFFPALGFGDVFVLDLQKPSIAAVYYPWTIFSNQSKFIIFRGVMSGIVSGALGKKILFKNYDIDIKSYLTLIIS
ncbi:MAG: hypothetical protein QHH19_01040 [Candidatus Thermoplasmatota archaeon]|jgi:predicted hydrocarbon binding protein|nr:hypothetical protein [Candidatus Thermoplasmatota archaeon]